MRSPRLEFSTFTMDEAYERAKGQCECCNLPFGACRPEYHHRIEAALGGDNSLSNCWCICPKCHRLITTKVSIPRVAKVNRIRAKNRRKKKSSFYRSSPRVKQLREDADQFGGDS